MSADLEFRYRLRHSAVLEPLAHKLEEHLREIINGAPRIDRIQARAKGPSRFLAKAEKENGNEKKYNDPLNQIQDQIGVRIITFYLSDVEEISSIVQKYFRHIERRQVVPESDVSFGYFGFHYILPVPSDIIDQNWNRDHVPEFFELQIKTLFQHAWSEANHDLGYKELQGDLTGDSRRRMAWASAQAWGADQIFDELFRAYANKE